MPTQSLAFDWIADLLKRGSCKLVVGLVKNQKKMRTITNRCTSDMSFNISDISLRVQFAFLVRLTDQLVLSVNRWKGYALRLIAVTVCLRMIDHTIDTIERSKIIFLFIQVSVSSDLIQYHRIIPTVLLLFFVAETAKQSPPIDNTRPPLHPNTFLCPRH